VSAAEQEAAILKDSDFDRCTFEPSEMECEGCDISGLQLYYRRTSYEYEEGEYKCLCCVAVGKANGDAEGHYVDMEIEKDSKYNNLANLLLEVRSMRQPATEGWTGEYLLPGWMIQLIDDRLTGTPHTRDLTASDAETAK